jgi:hypothetical protein
MLGRAEVVFEKVVNGDVVIGAKIAESLDDLVDDDAGTVADGNAARLAVVTDVNIPAMNWRQAAVHAASSGRVSETAVAVSQVAEAAPARVRQWRPRLS